MKINSIKIMVMMSFIFPLAVHAKYFNNETKLTGFMIEKKVDDLQSGYKGERRSITLIMRNAKGKESKRKLVFESREQRDGNNQTKLKFVYPPDTKGTTLLTHENGKQSDDKWLYLPALKRVKRIATANESGSFMGSEFAYEDISIRQLEKYNYRLMREEIVSGERFYVIECIPVSPDSGYSRVVRWRNKENLQEYKAEFYDRRGSLLKTRRSDDFMQVKGYWRAQSVTMTNAQTKKESTLAYQDNVIGINVPARSFRVSELGKRD